MHAKRSIVCSLVAVLFITFVIAAPALQSTSDHVSAALQTRSTVGVAVYFDQKDLVKRAFNVSIVVASLAAGAAGYAAACAAFSAISAGAGGAVCGIGAFALLAGIAFANWAAPASTKARRDATIRDPRYWGNVILNYDPNTVMSNTQVMAAMYNGSVPVHVAYHNCNYNGCYDLFYENYFHTGIGRQVHKISQKPRGEWASNIAKTGKAKRQTDESASDINDPETEENGTAVYADYIYWDESPADEMAVNAGETASDFQDSIYTSGANQGVMQTPGYYCASLIDESDSGAVDSTGYVSISENENEADPDNEASYLETCYDDQFGKRRRV